MVVHGKRITDECRYCGDILQCETFMCGHGINRERSRMLEMVDCQIRHRHDRYEQMKAKKQCGVCRHMDIGDNGYVCSNEDGMNYSNPVRLTYSCAEYDEKGK